MAANGQEQLAQTALASQQQQDVKSYDGYQTLQYRVAYRSVCTLASVFDDFQSSILQHTIVPLLSSELCYCQNG